MKRISALMLLVAFGLLPVSASAGGKKGKLSNAVEVTRHGNVQVRNVSSVAIEGLTATITLDHEAPVLVHGVIRGRSSFQFVLVSLVVDGQADPDPLEELSGTSFPIIHSTTLAPGTHTFKVVLTSEGGSPADFEYGDGRLVVLSF